jgi:signal peptidase I
MEAQQPPSTFIRDAINIVVFVVLVVLGAVFINTFVFRSFSVTGPSMEKTLYTDDRLIVNKLPVTWEHLIGKQYVPKRGEIIVFENPFYQPGRQDEFIVKRVIGLPGERVTVKDGVVTVYNNEHPQGFQPDKDFGGEPGSPTSGDADRKVPAGELFVSGDHREGNFSLDSRNGLGTIPLYDVVGPVGVRIYPFNKIRFF